MGIPVIDELGNDLEGRWAARDYDSACFADLCAERLTAAHLHGRVDPDEIVRWVLRGNLPEQADPEATFGQPPVTLFRARRFYVSALFWVDATTSIHDHGFSGAFALLSGSSIETRFKFETTRMIGGQLRFGTLMVQRAALVTQGDVHPIVAGPRFIHSLFHLARPSVSLVVRTFHDVDPGLQLNYSPPGIAHNTFHPDPTLDRITQTIEMLRKTDDPTLVEKVGELISRSDLHTAFIALKSCLKMTDRRALTTVVGRVRDEEAVSLFSTWVNDAERLSFLQSRRAIVRDPDLRFLLAVLLNSHRRVDALTLVSAYAPTAEPARQIAAWVNKLSTITARLQLADGAWEPNLLGLPAFTPRMEEVLAAELRDETAHLTDEESAFLARLRALPALTPLFRQ